MESNAVYFIFRTSIIINTNVVSEITGGINMDCCYL